MLPVTGFDIQRNDMQIIYPGYYTGNYLPDDTFAEEYRCAQQQGVSCLLLDKEVSVSGTMNIIKLTANAAILC
ncbi:hypothetical protein CSB69_3006 [Morganella morganii]|nr:hypothetical protein CSB69_3006 [Morganella morganii]EMP52950.1 hypothetical protein C790_02926 [Morganella morganii SC01]